jgi:hypothetical protein
MPSNDSLAIYNIDSSNFGWSVVAYDESYECYALITAPDTFHNTVISLVRILDEKSEEKNGRSTDRNAID